MANSDQPPKRFLDGAYAHKTGDTTHQFYADWAATYDQEVQEENDYAQPVRCADALIELLPERGIKILDVGCGTGLSGEAVVKAGYSSIDGCDFSTEMLDLAGEKQIYQRLFHADLNVPPLDAGDAGYDAALAVGVFSFGHVSADALDDILRIIKPGGALIIGLNEKFYDEGSLTGKLADLENSGQIRITAKEHGEHLPGTGLKGWVISVIKSTP